MFGISFLEIGLIATVALIVVGPQKLPGVLRTLGQWVRKLRRLTTEVRAQSGIDEVLRQEGLHGGVNELRSLIRGELPAAPRRPVPGRQETPYNEAVVVDTTREYPPEGVDAAGALPDDLVAGEEDDSESNDFHTEESGFDHATPDEKNEGPPPPEKPAAGAITEATAKANPAASETATAAGGEEKHAEQPAAHNPVAATGDETEKAL